MRGFADAVSRWAGNADWDKIILTLGCYSEYLYLVLLTMMIVLYVLLVGKSSGAIEVT